MSYTWIIKLIVLYTFLPLQSMQQPLSNKFIFDYPTIHKKLNTPPYTWYKVTHFFNKELKLILHTLPFMPTIKMPLNSFINLLRHFHILLEHAKKQERKISQEQFILLDTFLPEAYSYSSLFFKKYNPDFKPAREKFPKSTEDYSAELNNFFAAFNNLFMKNPQLCQTVLYNPLNIPKILQQLLKIPHSIIFNPPSSKIPSDLSITSEYLKKAHTPEELLPIIYSHARHFYFLLPHIELNDVWDDIILPNPHSFSKKTFSSYYLPDYSSESCVLINFLNHFIILKGETFNLFASTQSKKQALYNSLRDTSCLLHDCFGCITTSENQKALDALIKLMGKDKKTLERTLNNTLTLEETQALCANNQAILEKIIPLFKDISIPQKRKNVFMKMGSKYIVDVYRTYARDVYTPEDQLARDIFEKLELNPNTTININRMALGATH